MAEAGSNQEYPTILGPDANFKGEMNFEKGLRLMGRFEGKMNTPGRLHIAKDARMQADVDCGALIVEGDVKGKLKATARYEGDLRASKLTVDEGAVFNGHVTVGPEAVKGGAKPSGPSGAAAGAPRVGATGPAQPQGQPVK
jgi:cytoskeletal protein CcmA (bactofilin family)